eukprot:Blabericola_migrator_1__5713@NODE_28_length_19984_cov_212_654667_g25_i0_p5_GENE_NODE_28_length_19984_cov_212_654667_g25_i0NODE_28_length_19984_cov_212_654667_g25_i0_p5_ORF_typecomplete_len464_score69_19Gemini_AL1_M/PF08283_11/7_5e03Gemini_AL1_M/PF08283_11/0_21Gemini_AL1_M/PF08283_11/4e02_NODE_28_length_19984_cov_212_654667_g25_i01134712738
MHPSFPQAHVWVPHIIRFLRPIEHVKFLLIDETKDALLSLQSDETERIYMLECLKLTFGCWTPEFQAALMQTEVQPMESFPKTWFTFLLMLYETMITHPYQAPDRLEYDQWRWIKVPDETVSYYNHQLKFICPAWHAGLRSPRWDRYYKDIAVYKLVSSPSSEGGVCTTHSFLHRAKDVSFTDVVRALRARDLTAISSQDFISARPASDFMQIIRESHPFSYIKGWEALHDVVMDTYGRMFPETITEEDENLNALDVYLCPELWMAPFVARLVADEVRQHKLVSRLREFHVTPANFFRHLSQVDPRREASLRFFGLDLLVLCQQKSRVFSLEPPQFWDFSVELTADPDVPLDQNFFSRGLEYALHVWFDYEELILDRFRKYITQMCPWLRPFNLKENTELTDFIKDYGDRSIACGLIEFGLALRNIGPQALILGEHGGVLFDRQAHDDHTFAYYWEPISNEGR